MFMTDNKLNDDPIDFVIAWVDGSDRAWLNEKRKYDKSCQSEYDISWANGDTRYRDWNLLRYWFRGVEKFAPWVNHVWFVTWGHYPSWLATRNQKLTIIRHDEYIPEKYLPTFSSHTIELNLHRISGLTEQFVYFNDDMFITSPTRKTDFFKHGTPCDTAVLLPITLTQNGIRAEINDLYVINEFFEKRSIIRQHPYTWFSLRYGRLLLRTMLLIPFRLFPGFYISHLPCAYRKQTLAEVWKSADSVLNETCMNKFRTVTDVNQWLFEYWQFCKGIYPRSPKVGKYYEGIESFDEMCSDIRKQKYKMVCCNDSPDISNFEEAASKLRKAFDMILPDKCSFEV